jgi:hypothetical protein
VKGGGGRKLAAPFYFVLQQSGACIRSAALDCMARNPKFRMFHQNALKEALCNR